MKGYYIQLFLVGILLLSGCMPFRIGVAYDNGRDLPKWPSWDFKGTYAEGNAPLPVDVIYIHKSDPREMLDGEIFTQYSGLRFFEHGNVFLAWDSSETSLIDNLVEIKNGSVGYYSMQDNQILMENFTRSMASFWGTIYAGGRGVYNTDKTISIDGFGANISNLHDINNPQIYTPIPLPDDANRDVDW